tara:strand:+ start:37 stop:786 length:750 start_codon:yes stop_codon:yes gene_type:complete
MQALERTNTTYEVKNLLLTQPADWFIQDKTFTAIKESQLDIVRFLKSKGQDSLENLPLHKIIKEPLKDVYTAPIFSETFCDIFNDELENIKQHFNFEPNTDEDVLRQIPEIVLQDNIPELYLSLLNVVLTVLNPLFMGIWGRMVTDGGIQIANYNIKDKKQGAWHHDASADISVVVPLNTGEYKGGGTEFQGRGIVNPLPTGSALIFPSFTHMHRGLAVQSGNRYLLVFWLISRPCWEDKKEYLEMNFI